jgi:hypothetical protein
MITEFCGQITVIVHDIPVKIILILSRVVRFPKIKEPKRKAKGKNKKNDSRFPKIFLAKKIS